MRFFRNGLLAIEQKAFFFDFPEPQRPKVEERDGVAIVTVRGPLVHHDEGCFDSYDAIKARVREAVGTKPKALLLSVDSPGGLVSGCFDTSTEIRAICEEAQVPLYGYVDGQSASAAVALLCAADTIFIPPAGVMGSVGIVEGLVDETQMDARMGLAFVFVSSGARKLDGNPHAGISDEAIAATQARVNTTAERFFELVADSRGLEVDAVRALQAGIFIGQQAIDVGLADELATEDEAIAQIAQWATTAADPSATGENNMKTLAEIRAALKAVAEGDGDEKEKKDAEKMLAALEQGEEGEGEPNATAPDGGEEPIGEGDDGEDGDTEPKPAPSARAAAPARQLVARVDVKTLSRMSAMERELASMRAEKAAEKKATDEAAERAQLFASRSDLSSDMVAYLASSPIEEVRRACQPADKGGLALGPGRETANPLAASAQPSVRPTLGTGQGRTDINNVRNLIQPGETDKEIMDRKMGIRPRDPSKAIRSEGNFRVYGCLTPDEARRLQAQKQQAGQS